MQSILSSITNSRMGKVSAVNKRQKVRVNKALIGTTAILMKEKMLQHDSIAKAKKVLASNTAAVYPDNIDEMYCEFMTLKITSGDYNPSAAQLSPGGIVDEFWHAHILDTAGYAKFFKDVNPPSGEMVHHDALKSQESVELINKRQEKTRSVSLVVYIYDVHL